MISSAHAIVAVCVDADFAVVEILWIGGDGDDGQVVLVVAIDITSRDNRTWKHSLLEEAEAIDCCLADVEDAVFACRTVCERWRSAVCGVAQSGSGWDVDLYGEWLREETGISVNLGCVEAEVGEVAFIVRCCQSGFSRIYDCVR